MRIEVINEKRLNHVHYCRVHKENQQLSGSFWVPSKSKSKNKKMFSIELNDRNFLVCDPEHIFKQKISGNKPSECILNLMNILIQEDMEFLQKLEMKLERIEDQLISHTGSHYESQIFEMHQTQVEMRQNQIMQFLTIVTTIFMPLTLITGWYGMNFKAMPELDSSYGYFIVIGVCILIIILEVIYFKKKKWF